jgi:hypothetical protein
MKSSYSVILPFTFVIGVESFFMEVTREIILGLTDSMLEYGLLAEAI